MSYNNLSDKQLREMLFANGSVGSKKEAKERVARMSKEDKEKLSNSIHKQAKQELKDN